MILERNNFMNFSEDEEPKETESPIESPIESSAELPSDAPVESLTPPVAPPKKSRPFKKIIFVFFILLALTITVGASFYIYQNIINFDPVSLIPADAPFYFRIKINPDNEQVKNFKGLLNKFPNYGKISDAFDEEYKNNPVLKKIDLTIFDEMIFTSFQPVEELEKGENYSFIVIFSDPDLTKINELIKDIKKLMEESKDKWELKEEKYKNRTILTIVPKESYSEFSFSISLINGQFVVSYRSSDSKLDDIKKIIDVADSKEITKLFAKDKVESIASTSSHQKISSYLPKEYLVLGYSQQDWSKIFDAAKEISKTENPESPFTKYTASSLDALFNLSFLGLGKEETDRVVAAWAIMADENELRSETYSLDLREQPFQLTEFPLKEGLSKTLPEKIKGRELVFYAEARDLKSAWDQMEKIFSEQLENLDETQIKEFYEGLEELEKYLNFDFKEDILSLFTENYGIFLYADFTGEKEPVAGLIFAIDDETKTKDNLLKIEIPDYDSFSKELVDAVEVYTMPVYEEFGLNFAIRDKKLIFSLTKQGTADFINSYSDSNQTKLMASTDFSQEFEKAPKNVTSLSYTYPYAFLGAARYGLNYYIEKAEESISSISPSEGGIEMIRSLRSYESYLNETMDKGVAPYLKMLKRASSYSYSPENGLIISKGRLLIEDLSSKEKYDAEQFWQDFMEGGLPYLF